MSALASAPIYIDANVLIYSIERIQPYTVGLDAFWQEVSAQHVSVLSSELTALESPVGPLRARDAVLETLFRQALFATPDLRLLPVSLPILSRAANYKRWSAS